MYIDKYRSINIHRNVPITTTSTTYTHTTPHTLYRESITITYANDILRPIALIGMQVETDET